MLRRLAMVCVVLIGLTAVPTHSNDIAYAIRRIEQGLKELTNFYSKICSNYLGCYQELSKRVLNGYELKNDKSMTREKCLRLCKDRNFRYAGVQFSSECFCGNELNTTKRPEKECNMPCSGNKIQICGGNMKMSVYLV